jgi:hypothetical protein
VDTEGPQTEQIKGKAPNVVRLPVDWLGPRDELVPLAPAPPESARSEQATPPSAADFWGERAEAVQDVLQGPAPPPVSPGDSRAAAPADRVSEPRRPKRLPLTRWWSGRERPRLAPVHWGGLVAAGCLIIVAGSAAVISGLATNSSRKGAAGTAPSTAAKSREPRTAVAAAPAIPALLARPKHRASAPRSTHPARRHKRAQRPAKHHARSGSAATPVRYSSPAAPPSPGGASTPAANPSPSATSTPAASSSGSVGGSSTAGSGASAPSSSSSSGSGSGSGNVATHQSSSATSASASQHSSSVSPTGASGALGPIGSPNG